MRLENKPNIPDVVYAGMNEQLQDGFTERVSMIPCEDEEEESEEDFGAEEKSDEDGKDEEKKVQIVNVWHESQSSDYKSNSEKS